MVEGVYTRLENGDWGGKIPGDYEKGEQVTAILHPVNGKPKKVRLEIIDRDEGAFEFEGQNIGIGKILKKSAMNKLGDYTEALADSAGANAKSDEPNLMKMSFLEVIEYGNASMRKAEEKHSQYALELKKVKSSLTVLEYRAKEALKKQKK